ncbi:hypothetical protein Plhal703r1_c21g0091881 [Plasmopara halstedii]
MVPSLCYEYYRLKYFILLSKVCLKGLVTIPTSTTITNLLHVATNCTLASRGAAIRFIFLLASCQKHVTRS